MSGLTIVAATLLPVCQMANEAVDRRLTSDCPDKELSRFLDYPPGAGKLGFPGCLFCDPFPPNPDFWLKDVDFSCVSPWNDSCGAQRAGTLISKRHVIFAKHFPLWKGVRILFVDTQGKVCPCRIEATREVPKTDIMIGLLDYEVTPDVHPAKVLPEGFDEVFPTNVPIPVVTFNREEKAMLTELTRNPGLKSPVRFNRQMPTSPRRKAYYRKLVVGDSGNPAFALFGNQAVLLFCVRSGGLGWGPHIYDYRKEIQKAMDELCPGYKLQVFDFTTVAREQVIDERR